jgi:NAD+ diphosphatase
MRWASVPLYTYWFVFRPKTRGAKIVLERGDQIYLVMHSYGARQWALPGGGSDGSESFEDTILREVREELEIEVRDLKLCGEIFSTRQYKRDTVAVFSGTPVGEPVIDGVEILEGAWFPRNTLPDIGDSTRAMLDTYNLSEAEYST